MRKLLGTFALLLITMAGFALTSQQYLPMPQLPEAQASSLTSQEQQILALVNGSRAYDFDMELETIAFKHFDWRSSGSPGAYEAAQWIEQQFESFGLDASLEPFEFKTWNLTGKPSFTIDDDGSLATTLDQLSLETFLPAHLSWPTPTDDVFADLVMLPLPQAANWGELGMRPINETEWAVNTTGKVVLTGREARSSPMWLSTLSQKLASQTPAALIFTWWYDWMAFTPVMKGSSEGRPYWGLSLPVGSVDYHEGQWIRNREATVNISAIVSIKSVIGMGTHYNVIGRLDGYKNPEKQVIVSAHYDTVTCSGFCDNGAGTAGIIELAKVMTDAVRDGTYRPRYTLLFVAFAAEEFFLVGSINYVKQHKSEMPNIVAVINLDCIGSDNFYYTETYDDGGANLDETVNNAAQDIGISATIEPPGGSDHETFRNPGWAHNYYYNYWGLDANISDAAEVRSSILLISMPLFYYDQWNIGNPGWIHTSNDNSTSTQTLNWVEKDDLENHIKVAALTILRVSPNTGVLGDIDYNGIVDIYDAILLANAFGSEPGSQNWDSRADINYDGLVDIYDAIMLATHYGEASPQ